MKSFRDFVTLRCESTHGDPTPKIYRKMQKSHEVLPVDSDVELLPPPPSDDSEETRVELMELQDRSELVKDRKEMMVKWDIDIPIPFIEYMDENNLEYDKKKIDILIEQSSIVILKQKYLYRRLRPFRLAEELNIKLVPVNTETSSTPAYPSGHSTQSRLIALYLSERHPSHSEAFLTLADECGESRMNASLHYPSDIESGEMLANKLWEVCAYRGGDA